MKVTNLTPQILLFEGYTQKELALTFFRIEEFYESPLSGLNGRKFSVFDFLYQSMDIHGNIDYFSFWAGFNFPGQVVKDWWNIHADWTPYEEDLIRYIRLNVDINEKFYVIGALEKDTETIDHELAHALWYMDRDYMTEIDKLNNEMIFFHSKEIEKIKSYLLSIGYSENVFYDELQAYLITEPKENLITDFNVNYKELKPIIKRYKKIFTNYKSKLQIVKSA